MAEGCEVCGEGVGWPPCRLPCSAMGLIGSLKDAIVPTLGPLVLAE